MVALVSLVVWTSLLLGGQLYRYLRRASIAERAAVRWPVAGLMVTMIGFTVLTLVMIDVVGELRETEADLALVNLLLLCPGAGFALGLSPPANIDADRALRGLLVAAWSLLVLACAFVLGSGAAAVAGADPVLAGWAGAGVVTAVTVPLVRGLGLLADRVVYRGRADPLRTVAGLSRRLGAGADPLDAPDTVVRSVRTRSPSPAPSCAGRGF